MSWFDVQNGRLRFRGRLTRDPVRQWLSSDDGVRAVQTAARERRFSLIGRMRSARRRLSRVLGDAVGTARMREALAAECDRYLDAWSDLAYAPSLPRITIQLRRLVVVPRVMIVGRVGRGLAVRLAEALGTADLPDPFKAFFSRWVLQQMDEAVLRAQPSPARPVHARDSWACVGADRALVWIDPVWAGREWRGHVVMFEMPAQRLQRRDRQDLEARIGELLLSLPALSRLQRDTTVRVAMDHVASLR